MTTASKQHSSGLVRCLSVLGITIWMVAIVYVVSRILIQIDFIAWAFNSCFLACHLLAFVLFVNEFVVADWCAFLRGKYVGKIDSPSFALLIVPAIVIALLVPVGTSIFVLLIHPSQQPGLSTVATGVSLCATIIEIGVWLRERSDRHLTQLIQSGELDAALRKLQPRVNRADPKPEDLYLLGEVHQRVGRMEESLEYYMLGLNCSNRESTDLLTVASALFASQRFREGHSLVNEAIQKAPSDLPVLVTECLCLLILRRQDQAVNAWNKLKSLHRRELKSLARDGEWSGKIQTIQSQLNDTEPL